MIKTRNDLIVTSKLFKYLTSWIWKDTMVFIKKLNGKTYFGIMLITLIVNICACGKGNEVKEKEIILAKVGNKTISLKEFIRRAEYTIRPKYCNGNNNLQKKIILNSLIAEKMLSIELGKNNELKHNQEFLSYIQGRKEQAMREWLQFQEGTEKVKIAASEIQKIYNVVGRTYKVKYFDIPSDSIANRVKEKLANKLETFESLQNQIWKGKKDSVKEVKWDPQENSVIQKSLFSGNIAKDTVIGPLRIEKDDYILMKIVGWTDEKAVTEESKNQRWQDVREDIKKRKALKLYDKFIISTMKGKKLEFDNETFDKLVGLLAPIYVRSAKERQKLISSVLFNNSIKDPEISQLGVGIKGIYDNTFLRIDGKVWTVKDFMEELNIHPLVFRNKVKKEIEFSNQFRFAVADLVRDKYLTKVAYTRGYQNIDMVKENTNMWRDALSAQYMKEKYLKNTIPNLSDSLNTYNVIKDYLNPHIDNLQKKYSDEIEVNVKEFNKIQLTRVDLIVFEQHVPYPIMVPGFPQLTIDSNLDYGKPMK